MYVIVVVLLTILLPAGSAVAERFVFNGPADLVSYLGKWMVFWAGGVRLMAAGVRQVIQPGWTLREVFEVEDPSGRPVVQELGFANIAIGVVCLSSLVEPRLLVAGAIVSGVFYGLAGLGHALADNRNLNRNVAMLTNVAVSAALAWFVVMTVRQG